MLHIGRSLTCLSHVTTDCSYLCSVGGPSLRLWRASVRKYANAVKALEMTKTGKVKINLDPRVEALQDKLIYCDYIERRRLKFGWKINKKIEGAFKKKCEIEDLKRQMNDPYYSVALKYLRNEENQEQEIAERDEDAEQSPKPIYMPYASIDQYEAKEEAAVEEEPPPEPQTRLNPDYQRLYEKYLEAKISPNVAPRLRRKLENLEKLVEEVESSSSGMTRPKDNLLNVPQNWMTEYDQYNDVEGMDAWDTNYGTADSSIPISDTPCGGCGALLHCQNAAIPGYLPSELFKGLKNQDLQSTICQRCHFMKNYKVTLEVKVAAEDYPEILSKIQLKKRKAAVMLMIDLTDFPCSIWPDLPSIIGKYTPIFVVGNKIDLLPADSPRFLENVKNSLRKALDEAGIEKFNVKHIELISAETGFGVERLINKLHNIWKYKGDIYLIGCTNVGKSTLFNTLLQSDYCKVQAVDLIQRATTSPWPGTTLNLLKFPILNPQRWRLAQRAERLRLEQEEQHAELEFRKRSITAERNISFATLQEHIGRTFSVKTMHTKNLEAYERRLAEGRKFGIDENDDIYKYSKWCYDTPGVIHPDQVLHLLTTEELLRTLPKKIISPRSFIFKPGQTLFLAGLGRLDLLSGPEYIRITVFAGDVLPITICKTVDADNVYNELLQTDALVVPVNDPERLKIWPSFQYKEMTVEGVSKNESVCDILLSSAGWIAITPDQGQQVTLRAGTPEGRGIHQRTPALLPKSITLRGPRIKSSAAYQCGRQVYRKK